MTMEDFPAAPATLHTATQDGRPDSRPGSSAECASSDDIAAKQIPQQEVAQDA
jgi:hypothetical protein